MAQSKIQKIQLIAINRHKGKILDILQNSSAVQIDEIDESKDLATISEHELEKLHKIELDFANTDFAIKLLTPYGEKKGFLAGPIELSEKGIAEKAESIKLDEIIKECKKLEDEYSKAKNEINALTNSLNEYEPWKKLNIDLQNLEGTKAFGCIVGSVKAQNSEIFTEELKKINELISIEEISKDEKQFRCAIVFERELEKEVKLILSEHKFVEAELPNGKGLLKNHLKHIEEQVKENRSALKTAEAELKKTAKHLDDLKIVHDHLTWQKDKMETARKIGSTRHSFVIKGWALTRQLKKLEEQITETTNEFALTTLPLEEGETQPVEINNSNFISPFETLTRMYGLPKHDELDPTPYLSVFFIIYFALCLTDAGYGIIMFIVMALALKFMKLGTGTKRLVKLLMYGGIATAIIGTIFGGWFGFEASKVPEFLTYTTATGEKMFLLQQINSVTNPLAVLILAVGLGFFQIIFGVYLKFFHAFKTGNKLDAILDTGTWAFMLTGIGFFILAAAGVIPASLQPAGQWWVIIAALGLILTQGRSNKNPVLRILSGILSLYGLVSYMSDVLSYSRLLALGLATTIIGLAVNVIVDLAASIPYIGWLLAAVIFIGGHAFNLIINSLGSFIHSGRLQFVEFFSKFMEGGGKEFRPLQKNSKYVYVTTNK